MAVVLSHMRFSHRRSVLRPLSRTLHGLRGVPALIGLFRPICPSHFCRSDWLANPIVCASFPCFTPLFSVDSLDSEV